MPDITSRPTTPGPAHPDWAKAPVDPLPRERTWKPDPPAKGVGLCLSGGGFRAMLFHVGALRRLLETGFLDTGATARKAAELGSLSRVSSVSGGSITTAVLGRAWTKLDAAQREKALPRFEELIAGPIRKLADVTIAGTTLEGGVRVVLDVLLPGSVNDAVVRAYKKHLFGDARLAELAASPDFILNASNLQSGALWRFNRAYVRDWKVGEIKNPDISLARAVAASSAFPPFLSPAKFTFKDSDYTPGSGGEGPNNLQRPPYTTRVELSDGGVYDNLGLETVYKNFTTVFCSDGAAPFEPSPDVPDDWVRHSVRVTFVIDSQVRALRVRQLIASYQAHERKGAYWGIGSNIARYDCKQVLDCPFERTQELATVTTDLAEKSSRTQERLINWGYAICDAALRTHVDKTIAEPTGFPYPESGV